MMMSPSSTDSSIQRGESFTARLADGLAQRWRQGDCRPIREAGSLGTATPRRGGRPASSGAGLLAAARPGATVLAARFRRPGGLLDRRLPGGRAALCPRAGTGPPRRQAVQRPGDGGQPADAPRFSPGPRTAVPRGAARLAGRNAGVHVSGTADRPGGGAGRRQGPPCQ
jgi:hypothetical protein